MADLIDNDPGNFGDQRIEIIVLLLKIMIK